MERQRIQDGRSGFSLLETLVAVVVLTIGVLGLAGLLANGLAFMGMSEYDYIAQQKAAEAVESIFTARDMGQATWNSICNEGSAICSAGVFVPGPVSLCAPGPDGILGTADDDCTQPDSILVPNAAGNFNPPVREALAGFTRTIVISTVTINGNTIANLRQITVTINYKAGQFQRTYTLNTYISNFS
jgi:prepilin-type N-terminal cleavage/methylation domain-containing protein